jgi:hypothetical protein
MACTRAGGWRGVLVAVFVPVCVCVCCVCVCVCVCCVFVVCLLCVCVGVSGGLSTVDWSPCVGCACEGGVGACSLLRAVVCGTEDRPHDTFKQTDTYTG